MSKKNWRFLTAFSKVCLSLKKQAIISGLSFINKQQATDIPKLIVVYEVKRNLCQLKKRKKRLLTDERWEKPFIMSQAALAGTHRSRWRCRRASDKTFLLSAPPRRERSHHNLFRGMTSGHNHFPRQPLNEDRSAPLSHCTLTKLSFVCVALASPPTLCFNIAVLSNKLARWHRVHTQLARQQSALAIYPETLWIFVYLPTSHYRALPQADLPALVLAGLTASSQSDCNDVINFRVSGSV